MKQQLLLVMVLVSSCSKAGPAKNSAELFAGSHGVVVTATEVRVDGKSLGILPQRLVTDRDALKAAVGEAILANAKTAIALAYTDDASGDAVLGALRGIEETVGRAVPKPPAEDNDDKPDESGGTGTAMALDEGRMGGQYKMVRNGEPAADTVEIPVTAMVGGKPAEICRIATPPLTDPSDDDSERVMLTLKIGHAEIARVVTRVNDSATIHAADLDRDLHAQKASSFFSDRDDIELAAAADATGADVTPVIATACKSGFRQVRPASIAELSKRLGQK